MLANRQDLRHVVERLASLGASLSGIVLVGGGALLALSERAAATRDVDILLTVEVAGLRRALGEQGWAMLAAELSISTRCDAFEVFLPLGWEDRMRHAPAVSAGGVRVFTPAPEDLAIMKMFRLRAKDASDIALLAGLPGFDSERFRSGFIEVLSRSIGDPAWHAQSFAMVWNALYPDEPVEEAVLLRQSGHLPGGTGA